MGTSISARRAFSFTILGTILLQILTISPAIGATSILTIATDATNGISSLGTGGGQKLIQDGSGKMIAVYVDTSGRIAIAWSNSDPSTAGSWSAPVKSSPASVAYTRPAAVLVSATSMRIVVEGGTGTGRINDLPVTIQRDTSSNIVGVSFGTLTTLDSSGSAKYPAATLAHNGDILAVWNWLSTSDSSRVKSLRWKTTGGWVNFAGTSATPDDAIVDSSNRVVIFPSILERGDNNRVYVIGSRVNSSPNPNMVFNKANFDGSNWSWATQTLNYETNTARGLEDVSSIAWDAGKNSAVVAYDMSGTNKYGVFTLDSDDKKTHLDTPDLTVSDNDWGTLGIDPSTGDYYIFIVDASSDGSTGKVGYTKRTSGSWSTTPTLLDSETNNLGLSARRMGASQTIDLLYAKTGTSSANQLRFLRLSNAPAPTLTPTSLTITSSPNPASETRSVTISGRLTNANSGAGLGAKTVNVQQSLDQANWSVFSQVTTLTDGSYQTTRTFTPGTYYLRSTFQGDATYSPSTSTVITQTVRAKSTADYALVVDNSGNVYRFQGDILTFIAQPTMQSLRGAAWNPNGNYALIVGHGAMVMRYDGTSFTFINTGVSTSVNFQAVAWKPDGSFALIGGSTGTLLRYDGVSMTRVQTPTTNTIRAISWTPSGSSALLAGSGGSILSFQNGVVQSINSGTTSDLYAAAWNPSGLYALAAGTNGTILKYDGSTVTALATSQLYNPSHIIRGIAYDPSGTLGLIVGDTGLVISDDGTSLTRLTYNGSPNITTNNLYAIAWSSGTATILGGTGTVFDYDGTLHQLNSGVTTSLRGIGWTP